MMVGIEFECGSHVKRDFIRKKLMELECYFVETHSDGSVSVNPEEFCEDRMNKAVLGDWHGDLEITFAIERSNLKNALEFLHTHCVQNETCGNHFHIQLKKGEKVAKLFTFEEIIQETKDFLKSLGLGRESNSYCSFSNFTPSVMENQFFSSYKSSRCRYTPININPYYKYGTIECRYLPAFNNAEDHLFNLNKCIDFLISLENRKFEIKTRKSIKMEEICAIH